MGNSAAKKAAKPGKYSDFLAQLEKIRKDHPDNLCAKYLTSKIFLSYKPEQQEFLYRCCKSGVDNPDSNLGCYAMRPDDYKVFSAFFDPLIRSYHKADAKSKHVSDWDISTVGEGGVLDVSKLGLSELSMRVRVGRNLRTFNLPGMMDKAERVKFEKSMLKAFEKLIAMPEFGGRVYSLTPEFGPGEANPNLITEAEYQKLVDDHVMFKDMSADPYLKSAGIANDWPYGRGCYMSADGQVIVWMGEEDQLRIMCMKKGTKLNEVFERLNSVLQTIEKIPGMEFAWDENFGYVTSCPSNLGTGMRASVHVKVPNLTADGTDKKAKQICKPLGLSVRGLGGEHTPIGKDGTIDLSPSARLFIRERDIIAKLYEGIRQLMEEEGKLAPKKVEETKPEPAKVVAAAEPKPEPVAEVKPEPVVEAKPEPVAEVKPEPVVEAKPEPVVEAPKKLDPKMDLIMNESLAKNEYPAELMAKYKSEKKCSLMAKVMTPELFEKYQNHKTATAGWTIARAINTGVMHPSSFVGCHAGDHESYHDYSEFFYPVIEQYHVGFKVGESKQTVDLDPTHIGVELSELAKTKIITTRIRAARNLEGHPLNPGGTKESRLNIQEILGKAFELLPEDLKGQFFLHATMTKEEQQKLIDDHFLFRGADAMQAASGYHQFWPAGRGIFVNPTKNFVVWVNEGDHIRIISMQEGGDVKEVFTRLGRAISALEQGIRTVTGQDGKVFMEDEKLGTISCCPSNLGGGLRAGVHIRIPKLIEKIGFDKIDELARERFCQARGSSGEHSEVIDRIDVSNWRRLGFSEAELVTDMINCVNFFAEEEAKLE